jgi:CheY-like chemotaxis protein
MKKEKPIVLVVENGEMIADLIRRYLEEENYAVVVAHNGLEAIKVLEKTNNHDLPYCITMAIMMPEMNGLEACQHIKNDKRFKDVPIVMVSAQNDVQNQIKSIECGADDFLSKPIEKVLLFKKVENCVKFTKVIRDNDRLSKELEGFKSVSKVLRTSEASYDDDDEV